MTEPNVRTKINSIGGFVFKHPILLITEHPQDDLYITTAPVLQISGWGTSPDEAMGDLRDDMEFVWRNYAVGDKHKLTDKALAYGKHLRMMVSSVNTIINLEESR